MQQGDLTVVRHRSGVLVSTLPQAFQETAALEPDAVAIRTVGDKVVITWRQYAERVRKIATGLSALGVERGHTVGLMLRNRPEFHLTDTAIMHLGAIPFSIYNTSAPDQIRYLFSNAENKIVITEKDFLPAVKAAGADLAHVIVVDADVRRRRLPDPRTPRIFRCQNRISISIRRGERFGRTMSRRSSTPREPPGRPRASS